MGEAARGWVSRRFSLPSVARQYVDFYSQLCGRVAAGVPGA